MPSATGHMTVNIVFQSFEGVQGTVLPDLQDGHKWLYNAKQGPCSQESRLAQAFYVQWLHSGTKNSI